MTVATCKKRQTKKKRWKSEVILLKTNKTHPNTESTVVIKTAAIIVQFHFWSDLPWVTFFFFSVAKEDKKNVYSRFQVQIYNSVSPWSPYAAHSILFGFLDHNLAIRLKWYSFHCSQLLLIFPSLQWLLSLNATVWIVISAAKQRKKMKKYELNIMNHREKSVSKYYIFQT